jgi:hypothetical protein
MKWLRIFEQLARAVRPSDAAQRQRDFRAAFLGSPEGEAVLYEILTWAHVFRPVFVPGDPHATHYHDGERNIGLKILAALHAEPAPEPESTMES